MNSGDLSGIDRAICLLNNLPSVQEKILLLVQVIWKQESGDGIIALNFPFPLLLSPSSDGDDRMEANVKTQKIPRASSKTPKNPLNKN